MSRNTTSSAPSTVVAGGQLDRIAGVAQVDEVHALDDPAAVDVEAGDHPDRAHAASAYPWLARRPAQPLAHGR